MFFAVLFLAVFSLLQRATAAAVPPGEDGSPQPVAAAWYAAWHATKGFPVSSINWSKYNTLIYSSVVYNFSLDGSDQSLLTDFVSQAHKNGVAAHVSIGGWGSSLWWSSNVATAENRTAFVQTVANFAEQYELDGINFDWEYPAKQNIGYNTTNVNDTENFLFFLQELRAHVESTLTLSAATPTAPFLDASGNPSTNVSGFAKVLDYIAIMNYDVWGSWYSVVGPNAPLNDTCASSTDQHGSAVSAVKAWTAAGVPANQIVLGVASYGHSFSVPPSDAFVDASESVLAPYPKFNASNQPLGDSWDNTGSKDVRGVYEGPGGTFRLWGLVDAGFLVDNGDLAPGIYYRYDDCSQTVEWSRDLDASVASDLTIASQPYVYNKTSEVMISFDNAQSFAAKGSYIKEAGLGGFAMWEAGGDYHDILLDSIRPATGF